MPPAARVADLHTCPLGVAGTVMVPGCPTVLIGMMPAARMGDPLLCPAGPDIIAFGDPTVLIGFKPAARLGDLTGHAGLVSTGHPTVLIGMMPQAGALTGASVTGAPLVEVSDKAPTPGGKGK